VKDIVHNMASFVLGFYLLSELSIINDLVQVKIHMWQEHIHKPEYSVLCVCDVGVGKSKL